MPEANDKPKQPASVVLEMEHVDVSYFEEAAWSVLVQDVNWQVQAGDFWVVAGQVSSGKSSLLLTAAGLNRPLAGELRIFGHSVLGANEAESLTWRLRVGFVFERGGRLFSHLTVAQNVALPLQYHSDMDDHGVEERTDEMLAMTDLRGHAHRQPSGLTLSRQQRLGLARALALPVDLIFLDSPLSILSAREVRWWLNFLRKLKHDRQAQGKPLTIVASADDFSGWLGVADRFAIIQNKRFEVIGAREQVTASTNPVVREFMTSEI